MHRSVSIGKLAFIAVGSGVLLLASARQIADTPWVPLSDRHRHDAPLSREATAAYQEAIGRTAEMAHDPEAADLARHRGLDVLNLTWEDTGRFKNSSVGPNISDMTIQVGYGQPDVVGGARCMPVIRYPNYSDKSCDIDPSDFTLLVGNERGDRLRRVSLREFLETPTLFLSHPASWLGRHRSLIAPRDSHVLVSAQACFLPVPKEGKATFNPVLFNYQSVSGDPAVLTILATREGTSTTVIDNKRDSFREGSTWGQRLFHNEDGKRASLTGERLSDFHASYGGSGRGPGLSMVLLIQVPLKHQVRGFVGGPGGFGGGAAVAAPMSAYEKAAARSDVESAVIGHGDIEGPFTEVGDLAIERDPNFPVRVTVQFYKATSNGVVSEGDLDTIKQQIDSVYEHGDSVGSLVVDGETGRPTEYFGSKVQPAGWWSDFWQRYEANTGLSREEAIARLRRLLGSDYASRPVCDLYLRNLLRG
jgi:hypothetical protein